MSAVDVARRGRRRLWTVLPWTVLALENAVIFFRHYARGYGFPWDFVGTYYASVAYWTSAVEHSRLPQWMPFQSIGYPFFLNLQTGLWYPPLWVIPLLRIPYTLHVAVVVQALHVLFGAAGMYLLLRILFGSRREAMLGAFAFQLFGGFYANAEHVDIVRAFAVTPWLLYALALPRAGEPAVPRRLRWLPLFVYAMATGGYTGNLIAALLLIVFFVAVRLSVGLARGENSVAWAGVALAGVFAGLAMALVHLGPAWTLRGEFARYYEAANLPMNLPRRSLALANLSGLFLPNLDMPGSKSMNNTFVGFLVLAGCCLVPLRELRRLWPFFATLVLAAAMAMGENLPLYPLARRLVPPLSYSRFPASDYRGFAAAILVVFAVAAWRDLRRHRPPGGVLFVRLTPLLLLAAWGLRVVYGGRPAWRGPAAAIACLAAALAALALWQRSRRTAGFAIGVFLAVLSLDAARVLSRLEILWSVPDLLGYCRTYYPTPARMHDEGRVVDASMFHTDRPARPARLEAGSDGYRASGYLTGEYDLTDFGSWRLAVRDRLLNDAISRDFVRREWLPVLLEPPGRDGEESIETSDLDRALAAAAPDPRVGLTSYGIDRIAYRVRLDRPMLLIENETFFPGWRATLSGDPRLSGKQILARRVHGALRGWVLPAGEYAMEARFQLPGFSVFAGASAVAWIAWLAALALGRRRQRAGARAV